MESILYRVCQRMARSPRAWFESRSQSNYYREQMADRLFTATWRADRGAAAESQARDCHIVGLMARLIRSDMTPAQALRVIDDSLI